MSETTTLRSIGADGCYDDTRAARKGGKGAATTTGVVLDANGNKVGTWSLE